MTRADAERSASGRDGPRAPGRWVATGPWTPFLVATAVVLVASVVPVPDAVVAGGGAVDGAAAGSGGGPLAVLGPTGVFHLVGYAGLAALSARATGRDGRGLLLAAAIAVAVGFGVELVQTAIPWRTFAWRDSLVNAIGAAAGVVAVAARSRLPGVDEAIP